MAKKTLVVVESPAKAKTIGKYLGKNFVVEASAGHIKDLVKFNIGIDIENDFKPKYVTIRGKAPVIKKIKEAAAKADNVLIATDPDREGEAIAWHLAEEIKTTNKDIKRVVFNEITKSNIQKNIEEARDINYDVFMSQQARRVMDRIIGYRVSPFLSHALLTKTTQTLSAGRVQSVALRLICEREKEVLDFVPISYWQIGATFTTEKHATFNAKLVSFDGNTIKNPEGSQAGKTEEENIKIQEKLQQQNYIKSEEQANELLERITLQDYSILDISTKRVKRKPSSPFTTSLLQQDAARKLGFSNKKTMMLAQILYEGINLGSEGAVGLITYMRTDSVRVSNEAVQSCREHIKEHYGEKYLPKTPPVYSSKSTNIQDAHEAIRPTTMKYTPDFLRKNLSKSKDDSALIALYELIYNRFLASQMAQAEIDQTTVNVISSDKNFIFRATGQVIVFDGFLAAYNYNIFEDKNDNIRLPVGLVANQVTFISNADITHTQTKPPARYNEASLVKELDELGIGRPSTYAQIVSTLLDRKYVMNQNKAFIPTEIGIDVYKVLVHSFPDLFNVDFTAKMENKLDKVAEGDITYSALLKTFYDPFVTSLTKAEEKRKKENKGIKCELCGSEMVIKVSRQGRFLGCSNYPECKNTKSISADIKNSNTAPKELVIAENVKCPKCGSPMYIRDGKFGKFYGCSEYPKCKGIIQILSGIKCPKCGEGELVERFSAKTKKRFWGCSSYPECNYLVNYEPIKKECPKCHNDYMEIRYKKVSENEYEKYATCPNCKEKIKLLD